MRFTMSCMLFSPNEFFAGVVILFAGIGFFVVVFSVVVLCVGLVFTSVASDSPTS